MIRLLKVLNKAYIVPFIFVWTISAEIILHAKNENNLVILSLQIDTGKSVHSIAMFRSFVNISLMDVIDLNHWPVTKQVIAMDNFDGTIVDSMTAHNTTYTYYAIVTFDDGRVVPSNIATITTPDMVLINTNAKMTILIDKANYFLEICFENSPGKRFPVNFGARPKIRKTYYDCMTTPEGVYHVSYLRSVSTYHSAIGINYPNKDDYKRYMYLLRNDQIPKHNGKPVSIGGSIQIHGGGIGKNWTWGCIAMRNDDIDQLFAMPQLKTGVIINIVGQEFSRDSLLAKDQM